MKKADQISPVAFRFRSEDHETVREFAQKVSETLPTFCRKVVLEYVNGRLVFPNHDMDAEALSARIESVVDALGELNQIYEKQFNRQNAEIDELKKLVVTLSKDTFERIGQVIQMLDRTDRVVVATNKLVESVESATGTLFDESTSTLGKIVHIEKVTRATYDLLANNPYSG